MRGRERERGRVRRQIPSSCKSIIGNSVIISRASSKVVGAIAAVGIGYLVTILEGGKGGGGRKR